MRRLAPTPTLTRRVEGFARLPLTALSFLAGLVNPD